MTGARPAVTALGLVVGLGLGAGLPACASDPAARQPATAEPAPAEAPANSGGSGPAVRRVFEDCDPAAAARQVEDLVGRRALATLAWTGMSERAAELRIPLYVDRIERDAVGVRFMQFPMRDQYLVLWMQSGHIRSGDGDSFLLEPCSARFEAWPPAGTERPADDDPSG